MVKNVTLFKLNLNFRIYFFKLSDGYHHHRQVQCQTKANRRSLETYAVMTWYTHVERFSMATNSPYPPECVGSFVKSIVCCSLIRSEQWTWRGRGNQARIPPHPQYPTLTRLYWGNRGILTQSMMRTEVG